MELQKISERKKSILESLGSFIQKDKRGMSIGDIYPVVLTIGLSLILIAIVLLVLSRTGLQMDNGSLAQNATITGQQAISDFVGWFSIIMLIVAAAIIIGILLRSFSGGRV